MKKTFRSWVYTAFLLVLTFSLLIPGTVFADGGSEYTVSAAADGEYSATASSVYPASEEPPKSDNHVSYYAECSAANNWGPDKYLRDESRFSIAGTVGYIDGAFTSVASKKITSGTNHQGVMDAFGLNATQGSMVFGYPWDNENADNLGYVFEPVSGGFKIRTADGVYLKRTGGLTSVNTPKLGSTTNADSATTFRVDPTSKGYLIYEQGDVGLAALQLNDSGNLKMKFFSNNGTYTDYYSIKLYRKAYNPTNYLYGDMKFSTPGYGYRGPYTVEYINAFHDYSSAPEPYTDPYYEVQSMKVTLPCYYRDAAKPLELRETVGVCVFMGGLHGNDPTIINNWVGNERHDILVWTVSVPDRPSSSLVYTFSALVEYEEHNYAVQHTQYLGTNTQYYGQQFDSECMYTAVQPTCTKEGLRYRPCMNYIDWETCPWDSSLWGLENNPCHSYTQSESIPALGHIMGTVISHRVPQCENGASDTGYCARCNDIIVVVDESQPALGHDLRLRPAKAPTCTEEGNEAYYICVRDICNYAHSGFYLTDPDGTRISAIPTIPVDPDAHAMEDSCTLSQDGSVLTVSRVCAYCGSVSYRGEADLVGNGTADAPWQIASAAHWDLLGTALEFGFDTAGKVFALSGDISVTTTIGSADHPFCGVFDGAGHTLTVSLTCSSGYVAPFAYVSGATIANLKTDGTITVTGGTASGLAGVAPGGCTVTNCLVDVDIAGSGGGGHAGFVAMCNDSNPVTVTGSAFTGSISDPNAQFCAGFLGWKGSAADNCIYDGAISGGDYSNDINRTNNNAANCYSLNVDGIDRVKARQGWSVTAATGTAIGFGTPTAVYDVSGITAYPTGLLYNGVFYAGAGETVTLTAQLWEGYSTSVTASDGTVAETQAGWALTMPAADTVVTVVRALTLDVSSVIPLTGDSGSSYFAGQVSGNLFDGLTRTKWCSFFKEENWAEFHADTQVLPTAYSLTTGDDADRYPGRNPISWRLLGRQNVEDDWTVLAVVEDSDRLPAENFAEMFFPLNLSCGYRYYRFEITAVAGDNMLQLTEFRLFGAPFFGTAAFTVPADVITIEANAFKGIAATSVEIPDGCTSIGDEAFANCENLSQIRIPASVTSIGADVFSRTGTGTIYVFGADGSYAQTWCAGRDGVVFVPED